MNNLRIYNRIMDYKTRFKQLDEELSKVCNDLNLNKDIIEKIKTDMSRRNVVNSFRGMPANLILSMYKKQIEYLRDYGYNT